MYIRQAATSCYQVALAVFKSTTTIMIMPLDEIPPPHHGLRAHAKCFPGC